MSFAIKRKDGVREELNTIDALACDYFKQKLDTRRYCKMPCGGNWFDTIGWAIARQTKNSAAIIDTWDNVKLYIMHTFTIDFIKLTPEEAGVEMYKRMRYLKVPYDFIDHLESLGYTPEQIK